MEASLTEVLAMVILGLIIQQVVEVVDPFSSRKRLIQGISTCCLVSLHANGYTFVLPEYTERYTVLFLHPFDLRDWCWCVDAMKSKPFFVGYFRGRCGFSAAGNRVDRNVHLRQWP